MIQTVAYSFILLSEFVLDSIGTDVKSPPFLVLDCNSKEENVNGCQLSLIDDVRGNILWQFYAYYGAESFLLCM